MSGLFGTLPPPISVKREIDDDSVKQEDQKRLKTIESETGINHKHPKDKDANQKPPSSENASPPPTEKANKEEDQVTAALHRIHTHISNPKKFTKASELLRQLFSQNVLDKSRHGDLLFEVLISSMAEPTRANDPLLAREYLKLFTLASKHAEELFTSEQRAQLDVYGIYAVLLNQMLTTDDSFDFSKTVNKIKSMIEDLPPLDSPELIEEEEKALSNKMWNSEYAVTEHRRAALIACISAAVSKECYCQVGRAWARTTIDILVDHAAKHDKSFLPSSQMKEIEAAKLFVKEQKSARKGGPSNDGVTSFDRSRETWSNATVSKRGGLGSGDRQSSAWLG